MELGNITTLHTVDVTTRQGHEGEKKDRVNLEETPTHEQGGRES